MDNNSYGYAVDIVMCIDGTGGMQTAIERVKSQAYTFPHKLEAQMQHTKKRIDQLRVKVIVFRDYWADPPNKVMQCSEFFKLPSQSFEFNNFLSEIRAEGGGDEPENGLEALALALKSDWEKGDLFGKKRYVVMLFTDASAHSLDKSPKPDNYPKDIPQSFDELTDYWHEMPGPAKRLVLFAPDASPWTMIGNSWENTVHYTSEAGEGLEDVEMEQILVPIHSAV